MTVPLAVALLTSVLLTTCSQLLMKFGMSAVAVKQAIAKGDPAGILWHVALSPFILGGLSCFAISVCLWLGVLSRLNVSQAYPCVALGFVLTMLGGHYLFGETISLLQTAGLALIISGVGIVALG